MTGDAWNTHLSVNVELSAPIRYHLFQAQHRNRNTLATCYAPNHVLDPNTDNRAAKAVAFSRVKTKACHPS
jgi:hypothetical protein